MGVARLTSLTRTNDRLSLPHPVLGAASVPIDGMLNTETKDFQRSCFRRISHPRMARRKDGWGCKSRTTRQLDSEADYSLGPIPFIYSESGIRTHYYRLRPFGNPYTSRVIPNSSEFFINESSLGGWVEKRYSMSLQQSCTK